jgi:hypothetical protein
MLAAVDLHRMLGHGSLWLAFAAVAIATSYLLRWLATRGEQVGAARITRAREQLGLSPEPPRSARLADESSTDTAT